jgi:aerotaxis receptor
MSSNVETPFGFEELFFSRTDGKGLILTGNSVFKRIAGYEWDDLIGAPHNIVRHQDMPKGVFYLFWKTVKSGAPIGAYVKNKSKNGAYYWVFALAIPFEGGYVSIRLKPSSPIFEIVKNEYKNLLDAEKAKKLTPAESCDILLKTIEKLGFPTYEEFMVKAMMAELEGRQQKLSRQPIPALTRLNTIVELSQKLFSKSDEIQSKFGDTTHIPLNLSIQASRLSQAGDPLTVVANQYGQMTNEIREEFKRFTGACERTRVAVGKCQYMLCAAVLQSEVVEFFKHETDAGPVDIKSEMGSLERIRTVGIRNVNQGLLEIIQEFDRFQKVCEGLRGGAAGLEIVRLTGKIEVSRLNDERQQLDHLINQLLAFKRYLDKSILDVADFGRSIQGLSKDIYSDLEANRGLG